jgi:SepF-like predicted cell division protein (DUF552 family)
MPSFGLFHKQKKIDPQEQTAEDTQKSQNQQPEEAIEQKVHVEDMTKETIAAQIEKPSAIPVSPEVAAASSFELEASAQIIECKTYLKAIPLRDLSDIEDIKLEVQNGNILILRITPLASKSVESVKSAVNELYAFAESIGGDIARLGEERVVICPKNIKVWREKGQ